MAEDSKAQIYIPTSTYSRAEDPQIIWFITDQDQKQKNPKNKGNYIADSDWERPFLAAISAALASLLSKVATNVAAN